MRLRLIVLVIAAAAVATSCSSGHRLIRPDGSPWPAEATLHRYMDRWAAWNSLAANIKLTIHVGDTSATAGGHLIYLLGERYEIGFRRPFNRVMGSLFVTPEQIIWDVGGTPRVFGKDDTLRFSEMMPFPAPHWDPRDLLPFPISGRNGGFQVDSIWNIGTTQFVRGSDSSATRVLTLESTAGQITGETIRRTGCDVMQKRYGKMTEIEGWPLARRVSCSDSSGNFRIVWTISSIDLDAAKARIAVAEANPTGARPAP